MYPLIIQIRWMGSLESLLIEQDGDPKPGDEFVTSELWDGRDTPVVYKTLVSSHEINGDEHTLTLDYSPLRNPEIAEITDCWGESVIVFSASQRSKASATWKNDPPCLEYDGTVKDVKVIPARDSEFLGYVQVLRRKRRQAKFRELLLRHEPRCALTGESERTALEAAHLVEVRDDGEFGAANGFLLRADLHRLFDAGCLVIDPDSGAVELANHVSAESSYREAVKTWKLSDQTLKRVRKALKRRCSS